MTPENRVDAFIADYERANLKFHAENEQRGDFDAWKKVVQDLEDAHFSASGVSQMAGVIQSPPPHTVAGEKLTGKSTRNGIVYVETKTDDPTVPHYYEYEMRESGGDWRIARLRDYLDPAGASYMTDKERPRFTQPKPHPLAALPKKEAGFDGAAIFAHGTSITDDGQTGTIEVTRLGILNATTGVLVVGDLGYGPYMLSPLGQRVPPGQYPAEISRVFRRTAALRLLVSDKPVVRWHPADMGDGGHGVGVDAGNVGISDASALLNVKARDMERAFEKFAERVDPMMLTLMNPNDTVIADSGYGDGGYPVYWGVDAEGKLAQLVVDFWVVPQPARPGPDDEDE
jgi:hypothetical protein